MIWREVSQMKTFFKPIGTFTLAAIVVLSIYVNIVPLIHKL
jgi:hypothetical protein